MCVSCGIFEGPLQQYLYYATIPRVCVMAEFKRILNLKRSGQWLIQESLRLLEDLVKYSGLYFKKPEGQTNNKGEENVKVEEGRGKN